MKVNTIDAPKSIYTKNINLILFNSKGNRIGVTSSFIKPVS